MVSQFEVVTDKSGRINHFLATGYEFNIQPASMAGHMDGGEVITHKGREYDLLPNGSMVYKDVDVTLDVDLSPGVMLDPGVEFHNIGNGDPINIRSGARVGHTKIESGVEIGVRALILADEIGRYSKIGDYVRLQENSRSGWHVIMQKAVKCDREAIVGTGSVLGFASRIGFKSRIGNRVIVGHHSQIGTFTGAGPRGVNQDGPFIAEGRTLEPRTIIR